MGSSDTAKTFTYFQKGKRELQNHNQKRNKERSKGKKKIQQHGKKPISFNYLRVGLPNILRVCLLLFVKVA